MSFRQTPYVGIIKAGATHSELRSRYGDFEDWVLSGLGIPSSQVRIEASIYGAPLLAPGKYAGVVITGSHSMVTERELWSEEVASWLVQAVNQDTPVLGICYGHQLLAHALGGEVFYHPSGKEAGTTVVHCLPSARDDLLFGPMPHAFYAHVTHWQSVIRLPDEAVLLAENNHEPHHAFRIGKWAWGAQFHPEFNEAIMDGYLVSDQELLRKQRINVENLRSQVRATPEATALLRRFGQIVLDRWNRTNRNHAQIS